MGAWVEKRASAGRREKLQHASRSLYGARFRRKRRTSPLQALWSDSLSGANRERTAARLSGGWGPYGEADREGTERRSMWGVAPARSPVTARRSNRGRTLHSCPRSESRTGRQERQGESTAAADSRPWLGTLLSSKLVEQCLGLRQNGRIEALSEPAVGRGEEIAGGIAVALLAQRQSAKLGKAAFGAGGVVTAPVSATTRLNA